MQGADMKMKIALIAGYAFTAAVVLLDIFIWRP
jgi:hypothetical protein